MPTYTPATREPKDRVDRMLEKYHQPLRDAGLVVDVLMAQATADEWGDIKSPAVSVGGYPCAAKVRIIGAKDRVKGMGDAEIIIDETNWDELPDAERDALIDHELEHLELKYDKDGVLLRDDQNRPKLRLRKHDHQFGWFDSIARRHQKASYEVKQYEDFRAKNKQLWLAFGADEEIPQSGGSGRKAFDEAQAEGAEVVDGFHEEVKEALDGAGVKYRENVTLKLTGNAVKVTGATAANAAKAARKTRKKKTETQLAQAGT